MVAATGSRAQQRTSTNGHAGDESDNDGPDGSDAGVLGADALPTVVIRRLVADASTVIASGRGVVVTAADLYQRVDDANEPLQRLWARNPALVDELLDRIVSDRLLVEEARRRGFDRDPVVRAVIERALVSRLRATVINPTAGDASVVTMDDIRRFYDANQYRFHIPERRRARVIFVPDRRTAERVLRLATQRRHGRVVNGFRELAEENNTLPDLIRTGGDLENVTPQSTEIDTRLRDAIFAIASPGDVHPSVVRGRWGSTQGYFIVRLTSRRNAIDRTLEDSADWIRNRVVLQRRVDAERMLVERLGREARVVRLRGDQVVTVSAGDASAPD